MALADHPDIRNAERITTAALGRFHALDVGPADHNLRGLISDLNAAALLVERAALELLYGRDD